MRCRVALFRAFSVPDLAFLQIAAASFHNCSAASASLPFSTAKRCSWPLFFSASTAGVSTPARPDARHARRIESASRSRQRVGGASDWLNRWQANNCTFGAWQVGVITCARFLSPFRRLSLCALRRLRRPCCGHIILTPRSLRFLFCRARQA